MIGRDCVKCFEYKDKIKALENKIINLKGWKGADKVYIERMPEYWLVIEHRKDKQTQKVDTIKHKILIKNVTKLWEILNNLMPFVNNKSKYREIVPEIIKIYNLNIEIEAFNGGKNRALYYFPCYYYPLKILEELGFVSYSGKGGVKKLK